MPPVDTRVITADGNYELLSLQGELFVIYTEKKKTCRNAVVSAADYSTICKAFARKLALPQSWLSWQIMMQKKSQEPCNIP